MTYSNIDKIRDIKRLVGRYDLQESNYDDKLQLEVLCKVDYILCYNQAMEA